VNPRNGVVRLDTNSVGISPYSDTHIGCHDYSVIDMR
jgi:hypothetical protein